MLPLQPRLLSNWQTLPNSIWAGNCRIWGFLSLLASRSPGRADRVSRGRHIEWATRPLRGSVCCILFCRATSAASGRRWGRVWVRRLRCLGHRSLFLDKTVYFGPGDSFSSCPWLGAASFLPPPQEPPRARRWGLLARVSGLLEQKVGGGPEGPGDRWPPCRLAGDLLQGKCWTFPLVERKPFCLQGEDLCQVS